jgi:hypothetical protein
MPSADTQRNKPGCGTCGHSRPARPAGASLSTQLPRPPQYMRHSTSRDTPEIDTARIA